MGRLDLMVVPKQGAMYEAAVSEAGKRLGCDWDNLAVTRKLARQTYRWRARDFLLDGRTDRRVAGWFKVIGREHLDAAIAAGKGVVLLANHFGSHLLTSHWMFRQGYPLRWFGEKPRNVSKFMTKVSGIRGPLGQTRMFISRRSTPADAASSILRAQNRHSFREITGQARNRRYRYDPYVRLFDEPNANGELAQPSSQ